MNESEVAAPVMVRTLCLVVVLTLAVRGADAQELDSRMVIGTDVSCRAEPSRTSPAAAAPPLGETFLVRDTRAGQDQETWYAREIVGPNVCWILGSLTTPVRLESPDTALLVLAEHALSPATKATFEHLVRVDNVLRERRLRLSFYRAPATLPPLLELRHLQIVQAAAAAAGDRWVVVKQPLRMAWVLGHADLVVHFEPGANYHVPVGRFWDLFERHRSAAEAEQMAWVAATTPVYSDECYTDCVLSIVAQTHMRYWRAFPKGPHVVEAVDAAIRRAQYATQFCANVAEGSLTLGPDLARIIAELRSSLDAVTTARRGELLTLLARIDRDCRVGAVVPLKPAK